MKCKTIIYINKDDPRIFVYKHPTKKWLGVTLNFAHPRSLLILLTTLGPWLILIPFIHLPNAKWIILVFTVIWISGICRYYFRGAEKNLIRYPGSPSIR